MSSIPCEQNKELKKRILKFSEVLKTEAHTLGNHGLSEQEFYQSGLFRGSIERIRGQFSATMKEKRTFVSSMLNYMKDNKYIISWQSAGESNRHDYSVELNSGRIAAIELKGCLDGNNTNIFERPPHAHEFIVWSVCQNPGADPRHNAWSGIHTRLSAEIISREQRVDGLIIWDMLCGTIGRPCPKVQNKEERSIMVDGFKVPPPCVYLFPGTIPSPRNNPCPKPQKIKNVELLNAFHQCFGGLDSELNEVEIEVSYQDADLVRTTRISRNGSEVVTSNKTPIQRS